MFRRRNRRQRPQEDGAAPRSPMDLGAMSDRELVAAEDRRAAFSELYRRHAPPVFTYCRMRVSNLADAEDIVSVVFAQAFAAFPPDDRGEFRSWLFTIAHNAVVNEYRRKSRRATTNSLDDTVPDRGESPEDHAIRREIDRELRSALTTLTDSQRHVVELRLAGLTGAEIARVIGRSENAVKMLQFRAIERLRKALGAMGAQSTSASRPSTKDHADAY